MEHVPSGGRFLPREREKLPHRIRDDGVGDVTSRFCQRSSLARMPLPSADQTQAWF